MDLSEYAGSKVRIRFRGYAHRDFQGAAYVDDISLAEPGSTAEISAQPTEMFFNVHPDSSRSDTLTIINTGTNTLSFWIDEGSGGQTLLTASSPDGGTLADLNWLNIDPTSGSVPVGASQDVLITCAGSGGGGSYTGYLVISSNDPANDPLVVPVYLTVSDIYLLGPGPGDSLRIDETYFIPWSLVDDESIESFDWAMSTDGGSSFDQPIVTGYTGSSPYEWAVPNSPSDSCVIRIVAHVTGGDSLVDLSDGYFTILDPLSGVSGEPEVATKIAALYQNVPNPFHPPTRIAYVVQRPVTVSLTIYDVEGRVVRTLLDEAEGMGQGVHFVNWDGCNQRGLPVQDGVYFYRLKAGRYMETRKMILAK